MVSAVEKRGERDSKGQRCKFKLCEKAKLH